MPRASGDEYDESYERRAAAGENVHGEADFVMRFAPASVLDAGCGTGRIARELARRGADVVGVDLDEQMLSTARRKAPDLAWHHADLATIDLGRTFDVILLAGNVMIFLTPGTERDVVSNLARHLAPDGRLIAGFSLRPGQLTAAEYDRLVGDAGLLLLERWSTWDRDPWGPGGDYLLSVHRRTSRRTGKDDRRALTSRIDQSESPFTRDEESEWRTQSSGGSSRPPTSTER
jgi:SAM-dependent methyltransferase